ncbi:S-DNA-T family DNA segregation ATPase FtsK/SpoIIIE [Ruminiclostridium sufflavum DSM 19573]|uniref:S-DNA-T family DNA segregation ATPase FtsK/SpoIIIE n=1 Tax=Ruminiclostridium sufflavum DSM 19573 TaxID=1121337 RepID=A0A318XP37_9FIRM|nr:DNA translocase FtsK [Ruminiclostridium sufflavum]PYG89900.1 S-DNA-T family DNA segregation ATPase FtsK/SpoIIIE [Ruminiclostridium sufflavum DSM 19573]
MQVKKTQKKKKYKRVESGFSKYRNEIFGLILFAFGIISLFSFVFSNSMGVFGKGITNLLLGFLGLPAYICPLILIVYGVSMIFKKNSHIFELRIIYSGILVVLLSAFLQVAVFDYEEYAGRAFFSSLSNFYTEGAKHAGGGVLGGLISLPFLMTFQVLGTIIILTTISIIDIILLTNVSMAAFLRKVSACFSTRIRTSKENRRLKKAERLKELEEQNEAGDEETSDESSADKKKVINFKIERESRANKKPRRLGNNEAAEAGDDLPAEEEAGKFAKEAEAEAAQSNEQEEFTVSFTGFNELADELAMSDITNGNFINDENIDTYQCDIEKEEGADSSETAAVENTCGTEALAQTDNKGVQEDSEIIIPPVEVKPIIYNYPSIDLLDESKEDVTNIKALKNIALEGAKKLEDTLKSFGVEVRVINISRGPAVTRYELQPSPGVKVSKIVSLSDDIALNLAAAGVRIEAPIPGKAAVGIEVPNKEMSAVLLRDILESKDFINHPSKLAFSVGKDISGETVVADIGKMPHLLVAGATGSGKSVCINSLIMSILFKASPEEVKLLLVDPKVVELGIYNGIPHLLIPVVTDPKKAAGALNWAVQEMINRYKLFADKGVRDLKGYNAMLKANNEQGMLPQIVIIVDELADLMMAAPNDVEDAICRLAQMARAAGMHLVIATQRPSVDVITGVIKANIPSRISFAVSSQVDSRTILDMGGAEKLLGRGDMLFYPVGEPKPQRVKGSFVSDTEVERVVEYIKTQGYSLYDENIIEKINDSSVGSDTNSGDNDALLNQAIDMVVDAGQASVSLVQRKFKVGYSRAARIIDQMEARNIVGRFEGSKPRQVLISKQQWIEMQMGDKKDDKQGSQQQ